MWKNENKSARNDRDLNPGPRAPEARIIPLDQGATVEDSKLDNYELIANGQQPQINTTTVIFFLFLEDFFQEINQINQKN